MPLRATPNRLEIPQRVKTLVEKKSLTGRVVPKGTFGKINQVFDPNPGKDEVTYKVRFFAGVINEAVYGADEIEQAK